MTKNEMEYDPFQHHRRSIRLKDYDYSQTGAYYITLVAHNRENLFGEIVDGEMQLNEIGDLIAEEWSRSTEIRKEIELDEWVVMPNHLHGIVVINAGPDETREVGTHGVGATGRSPLQSPRGPARHSLPSFVAGFKSATTKRINTMRDTQGAPVWQRNYYEHIVRSDNDLDRIREYIFNNPFNWESDDENPVNVRQL